MCAYMGPLFASCIILWKDVALYSDNLIFVKLKAVDAEDLTSYCIYEIFKICYLDCFVNILVFSKVCGCFM